MCCDCEMLISGLITLDTVPEADMKRLKREVRKDVQKTTKKEEGEPKEEEGKSEHRWLPVAD